ncbi:glycosyltransferase family 39 protein [Paraburkholderia dinghuensis]|uniref:Glycosyltransferase n=1 Tax=Paraburkholderia dinghuensis TaxID=2305225 RepID=A0A3N6NHA2_9BURK|nr:glycosyltransferase family 39 protein [Paraburkholderia dinghuensis]RQH08412.1 glycosyltransferase [Paraburkholderia dinghuensis]
MSTQLSNLTSLATASDERAVARNASLRWLLPFHALVWTLAAWLARGNLDIQGDMVETYVWGIEWQAGYAKHPPLSSWVAAAWFSVFPHTDLAYFALSAVNVLVGLTGIVALAGCFVPRRLAIIAGLAMAVSPLYSNLAIKFNPNAILLSVWPWTAYFFVRYVQPGSRLARSRAALGLGVCAALAVLGKYFSIVLLLGLLLALLVRPAWRARLISVDSLIAVAAGVAVLTPHVRWMMLNHFPTLEYAAQRTGGTLFAAVGRFGIYTLAQIGYLALSFVFVLLMVRKSGAARRMVQSVVRPSLHPDLWWLALGPLFAVGVLSVIGKTQMASVWGMAQWFAIVPLWLAALEQGRFEIAPQRAVRVMVVYWALVLAVSAVVGYTGARRNTDDAAEPRAELATAAQTVWRERTGQPLSIVAGSTHEAGSVVFYDGGRARFWDLSWPALTPWFTPADFARRGALFVCRGDDPNCIATASTLSHAAPVALRVSKNAWGRELPARAYQLFVLAPQS